eukprot:TRINITY_DN2432_c2_g1_i2.p1 TRINITY_DN2432_c2_g1~~TRINITY_DN2432_c2_g1_i2.p1  ORF type:complete len:337 (-),score=35.02 TRINITY_DN2432_c2_g1_i2:334-1251(-)
MVYRYDRLHRQQLLTAHKCPRCGTDKLQEQDRDYHLSCELCTACLTNMVVHESSLGAEHPMTCKHCGSELTLDDIRAMHLPDSLRERLARHSHLALLADVEGLAISDALSITEMSRIIKLKASLEEALPFDCVVCCERSTTIAPVHGHNSTCTSCVRKFANSEVQAGRVPTCPTCSSRLTLLDLSCVEASEKTQRLARKLYRELVFGQLTAIMGKYAELEPPHVLDLKELRDELADGASSELPPSIGSVASDDFINSTATRCPSCYAPCHRVGGCRFVRCRCGRRFEIPTAIPGAEERDNTCIVS